MNKPLTGAEKMARYRARQAESGGRQIAVQLTPEATQKLDAWIELGHAQRDVINALLCSSRPKRVKG